MHRLEYVLLVAVLAAFWVYNGAPAGQPRKKNAT